MIVLYTDYGVTDPYVGQVHAVLRRDAPGVPVIDLLHTVPDFDIRAGAYLLPALAGQFPPRTVFFCVVDPGVGGERVPVMLHADQRWYVGPDNGLFHMVARRAKKVEPWTIYWRPVKLAASFHGRDLFAPVAARLARGEWPASVRGQLTAPAGEWPDDLAAVIFIDHYGNAMTGLRAGSLGYDAVLEVAGRQLQHATVFDAVTPGMPFWYENSVGLIEIAMNRGNAAQTLDLRVGTELKLPPDASRPRV